MNRPVDPGFGERDKLADDQMVALAVAKLAIERPGWYQTLRALSNDRGFLAEFDVFHNIHTDPASKATRAPGQRRWDEGSGEISEGCELAMAAAAAAIDGDNK